MFMCGRMRSVLFFSASHFELVEYQEPQHEEEKVCKRLTSPEYMNCVGSTSRSSLACLRRTCDASTSSESGEVSGIRSTLQFPDLQEKDVFYYPQYGVTIQVIQNIEETNQQFDMMR